VLKFCTKTSKSTPLKQYKKKKIKIRSGSQTHLINPAAGYPLVVLAFGNEINWKPLYFSRIASACWHRITPLWATATIRARPCSSFQSYAVSRRGKPKQLAYGHVEPANSPTGFAQVFSVQEMQHAQATDKEK
jgi:hypothetical protein